ncbi:MAG: hypothetical protein WBW92_09315 [Rhodanobacteraceae bacterium]
MRDVTTRQASTQDINQQKETLMRCPLHTYMACRARMALYFAFSCLLALTCSQAKALAGSNWTAAQWQALFEQVPPPPQSLAQVGNGVGLMVDDKGRKQFGPTDPVLLRSHESLQAGLRSMTEYATAGAAAAGGIDIARLQRDPAYAQQIEQKMAAMSQAERTQLAMKMAAAQRPAAQSMNVPLMRATGALQSYVMGDGRRVAGAARGQMQTALRTITGKYDRRHAALDKTLQDALKACPEMKGGCGDTDCPPTPACIADINSSVPVLISRHRKLAGAELAEERSLFAKTRATLQPVLAKTASLAKPVEAAGGGADKTQSAYSLISTNALLLQQLTATATLRAGYWQNIRQIPVRDDYFVVGNLGYTCMLGKERIDAPPGDLPSGW